MRIFVLGTGASGALLAQLLARQGHRVTCGDKDPERAKRFLGKKSTLPIVAVNARNLRGVVRAARGCQLLVNASPAVFNEVGFASGLAPARPLPRSSFASDAQSLQGRGTGATTSASPKSGAPR